MSTGHILTPTRRRAISSAAAAIFAVSAPVLAATKIEPAADAELLKLTTEFLRLDQTICQWDADEVEWPEDVSTPIICRWIDLLEPLAEIPATTTAGRLAKVQAAICIMRSAGEVDSPARDDVVRSALADVLTGYGE